MRADTIDLSGTGISVVAIKARVLSVVERTQSTITAIVAYATPSERKKEERTEALVTGTGPWTRLLRKGDLLLAKGRLGTDPEIGLSFAVDENNFVRIVHDPQDHTVAA
jgi:hypothetical protein